MNSYYTSLPPVNSNWKNPDIWEHKPIFPSSEVSAPTRLPQAMPFEPVRIHPEPMKLVDSRELSKTQHWPLPGEMDIRRSSLGSPKYVDSWELSKSQHWVLPGEIDIRDNMIRPIRNFEPPALIPPPPLPRGFEAPRPLPIQSAW